MDHNTSKVKSISEAFSMQPVHLMVGEMQLDRIDRVQLDQYEWVYIGYDINSHPLFRYLEKAVNVHYFIE